MTPPTVLLVDNGSSRPESTRNLRRIARGLSASAGLPVHPVSLQHAHKIPPTALDGVAADTFVPFMARQLAQGVRRFVVLPLFFGPSRALSSFIPTECERLAAEHGAFELQQSPVLCPLPAGEPRLARLLCDQLPAGTAPENRRVILVDHGSPMPEVTAVRRYLAGQMRQHLDPGTELLEAVMERRQSADYDFNGELLAEVLQRAGAEDDRNPIDLALLFLSPGRHAGSGGDIETICREVREAHPEWRIRIGGLIGEHPGLIPILQDRLASVLARPD